MQTRLIQVSFIYFKINECAFFFGFFSRMSLTKPSLYSVCIFIFIFKIFILLWRFFLDNSKLVNFTNNYEKQNNTSLFFFLFVCQGWPNLLKSHIAWIKKKCCTRTFFVAYTFCFKMLKCMYAIIFLIIIFSFILPVLYWFQTQSTHNVFKILFFDWWLFLTELYWAYLIR